WDEAIALLAPGDERLPVAQKRRDALTARLSWLTVRLPDPSATLEWEGASGGWAPRPGTPLLINPGTRVLIVRAPGHEPRRYMISLAAGEQRQAERAGGQAVRTEPAPVIGEREPQSVRRPFGYALGGLGVAALAVATVATIVAVGDTNTVNDHCNPVNKLCD